MDTDDAVDAEFLDGYREEPDFKPRDLTRALLGLRMLGDDLYLSLQANNIGAVDNFLNELEAKTLARMIEEERTPAEAFFLQAQTQMWVFALYELIRTWRQRAEDMIKWQDNKILGQMIEKYSKPMPYRHWGRESFTNQLKLLRDDPSVGRALRNDLLKTEQPFKWMELLRMSLAKHEVAKVRGSIANAPGYARIDQLNGSMRYEISNEFVVFDTLSRRDIANSFRAIPSISPPTPDEISSFRDFLKSMRTMENPFDSPELKGEADESF